MNIKSESKFNKLYTYYVMYKIKFLLLWGCVNSWMAGLRAFARDRATWVCEYAIVNKLLLWVCVYVLIVYNTVHC